jgi:hypothetical protein
MDRQYIDDHHIVARYLADRLSPEEREAFEAYYLEHPEILEELEATARFKAGLLQLQRSGELDRLIRSRHATLKPWFIATAAVIGVIAIGLALFANLAGSRPILAATPVKLANGSALAVTDTYQLFRMRSAQADAVIRLPDTPQAIELQILPEFEGTPSGYSVSLARLDGSEARQVARAEGLESNEDGFVQVYVDARRLQPGTYRLTLTNDAHTGAQASVFSLRVEAAAR